MDDTPRSDNIASGEDYVVVSKQDLPVKQGVLFIEARIRDSVMNDPDLEAVVSQLKKVLEKQLSSSGNTFDLLEDILANERTAEMRLGPYYACSKDVLQSLKVVEYLGPITNQIFNSDNVRVRVQLYALHHGPRSLEEHRDFPEAEITQMPHAMFEGNWDDLVFDDDIKGDLLWMITNILRFSGNGTGGDMNPVILLYGPPGTGKTSLCQGLAQKISIRHNSIYKETELIQIKTAAMLSKYYSESAKQVDKIFRRISCLCEKHPERFVCVLVDEVESIASSRQEVMKRAESQDSLRATNALLTGLDRTRSYTNLLFLCTSNMLESLDSAFMDRCGLKRSVEPPSLASQYEILRSRTQKLIARGVIQSLEVLPSYLDADILSEVSEVHPASRLLALVKLIRSGNLHTQSGNEISARSLTQLPEQAILMYLREEDCDLDMALTFFQRFVLSEQSQNKTCPDNDTESEDNDPEESEGVELRCRKRKLRLVLEEDCTIDLLEHVLEQLRQKDVQEKLEADTQDKLEVRTGNNYEAEARELSEVEKQENGKVNND